MPTLNKTYSKIIAAKPYEDVKSSNTKYMHELGDKTVVNFIYNFFLYRLFLFCKFFHQFYLLCPRIKWKIDDNVLFYYSDCFEWIQGKIDVQTAHTRSISWSLSQAPSFSIDWINGIIGISQIIWILVNFEHCPFNK